MASSISNIKWYNTIRAKLITIILVTTTLVLGITGILAYRYLEESEQLQLSQLADVSATRLSRHLSIPMWNLDREQVAELLSAEMQEQRVSAIVIRDEDNTTLFAAKERNDEGEVVDSIGSVGGQFINVDRDVMIQDDKIGVVSIFVTPKFMNADLKQFGQGVAISVIILNIVIFIIMMIVLGRVLVRPLSSLAIAAEQISRGDLNQRLEIDSRDEIGTLAQTFARMQTSVKVAINRLMKKSGKG